MGFGAPITNGQVVVVGGQCNFERWCSCSHGLTVGVGPRMMMLTKSRPCPTGCEGGHNGLCAAAYLAKAGKRVCVLERRHILGGAAVTEELVPGFKFSRAAYLGGLLRKAVISELELTTKHGLTFLPRPHNSFTPLRDGRSLLMGPEQLTIREIAKFSPKDAEAYPKFEAQLRRFARVLDGVVDSAPIDPAATAPTGSLWSRRAQLSEQVAMLVKTGGRLGGLGRETAAFVELLTAPASRILDQWFESDVLKATLATDAIIGAMESVHTQGSGYVLLHHVMSPDGWAYVQGGMGEVSTALASAALDSGATLVTDAAVDEILIADDAQVSGVRLASGEVIHTSCVLSNVTPHVLMSQLLSSTARETHLPPGLVQRVTSADYTSATTKINVAVDRLPQFSCIANSATNEPGPEHEGTIHLNCESLAQLHAGYVDTKQRGDTSTEPLIEMTIPSAIDQTIAPPGQHVVNLFVQYTPYAPSSGPWTAASRESLARHVFATIDTYAPGFTESVVGAPDVLTPPDLEAVFGLTGGNIMHGEMSLDRLYFNRPAAGAAAHKLPNVSGLYLCGAGCHPGGGVMAAAGRNAATAVLRDFARTDAEQERLA